MGKYRIYGVSGASKYIGEFEGNTKKEAIEKAKESDKAYLGGLCCQCAKEIDLGYIYRFEAEEV